MTPTKTSKVTKTAPPALATIGRNLLEIDLFGECSDDEENASEEARQGPTPVEADRSPTIEPASNKANTDTLLFDALQVLTQEMRKCNRLLGEITKGQQDMLVYARRTTHALEAPRPPPPPPASQTPSQRPRYSRY